MFVSWATGLSGEVVDQVFFYILAITVFLLGSDYLSDGLFCHPVSEEEKSSTERYP